MLPPMSLTDGVVTLRPLRADDAVSMYQAVRESLAELKPWMSWAHDGYQKSETRDWVTIAAARWNSGTYFGFAILETHSGQFLGSCSLSHIHAIYRFCNLGYWIRTAQRGQGFAVRAARLAARFGIEHLQLVRVEIVISVGNRPSLRVAHKLGAHREGILHNRLVVGSDVRDAVMYSLLPSDFGLAARI